MLQKFIFLACLLLATGFSAVSAQEKSANDDVIKIDTTLVSVPVIVSDRDGRYVPNLTATDFKLFQDGAEQKIDFFAATEEPLTVALLIDTSRSTQGVLGEIKDSAQNFIKLLQPRDRAMIVSFDYDTHILSPLTSNQEQLKRAIETAEIGEYVGTTLRDAVYEVVGRAFAGIKGRKAIILLTDGKDASSRVSASNLLYSLQESDTLVYTVFYETGPNNRNRRNFPQDSGEIFGGGFPRRGGGMGGMGRNRFPRGGGNNFPNRRDNPQRRERVERQNELAQDFLQQLSDTTAGRFYPSEIGHLKNTFGLIVDELRYQYRLGFYPSDEKSTETLHQLKVKVSRPEAIVRARDSYRIQTQ